MRLARTCRFLSSGEITADGDGDGIGEMDLPNGVEAAGGDVDALGIRGGGMGAARACASGRKLNAQKCMSKSAHAAGLRGDGGGPGGGGGGGCGDDAGGDAARPTNVSGIHDKSTDSKPGN